MRYMARHRTVQDKLMFIFSAKNLYQMYRRLRFVREYANYQKAQGEAVKAKQAQVSNKHKQLQHVKGQKNNLLYKGQQEHAKLEANKNQQQEIVNGLQKQQGTIKVLIAEQRKKDAALNAEIDRQVEIEVAKVRARAEAEARRQAAAAAAARQRRAAELARKLQRLQRVRMRVVSLRLRLVSSLPRRQLSRHVRRLLLRRKHARKLLRQRRNVRLRLQRKQRLRRRRLLSRLPVRLRLPVRRQSVNRRQMLRARRKRLLRLSRMRRRHNSSRRLTV